MEPWVADASDPRSTSLAARHGRNAQFGDRNCYTCHADYGMYGTLLTKVNGLHHVVAYLGGYRSVPIERAVETIRTYRPFPNSTCTHCHSTKVPGWSAARGPRVGSFNGRGVRRKRFSTRPRSEPLPGAPRR